MKKILLIDDNHTFTWCLQKYLQCRGYRVEYAYKELSDEPVPTFHKLLYVHAENDGAVYEGFLVATQKNTTNQKENKNFFKKLSGLYP